MSAPILTGRLRLKDETRSTLNSFRSRITSTLGEIGRMATAFLVRDVVGGMVRTARESIALAAEAETLQRSFTALVASIDQGDLTLDKLRTAVKGTVSDVGLLTAANNALALGLPVDELEDLFRAAMVVGHAMGRTTLEAVNDLVYGIGRGSKLGGDLSHSTLAQLHKKGCQIALAAQRRQFSHQCTNLTSRQHVTPFPDGYTTGRTSIQQQDGVAIGHLGVEQIHVHAAALTEGGSVEFRRRDVV